MRALLQIGHDLAAALDAACNGRPKALHRLRPAVPTPDQIEAAEIDRRAAEVRDRLPLARLTMAERIEAQERAEDHFEEAFWDRQNGHADDFDGVATFDEEAGS